MRNPSRSSRVAVCWLRYLSPDCCSPSPAASGFSRTGRRTRSTTSLPNSSREPCPRSRRWSTRQATRSRGCTSSAASRSRATSISNEMKLAHRLRRGQAVRRTSRRGLAGHRARLPDQHDQRRGAAGRVHHRPAVRQELPIARRRQDRRGAARRDRDHACPQDPRDPDGADARQEAHQGRDPHPVSEPGAVRQLLVRHTGRGADVLRRRRCRPERHAVRDARGHGAE